MSYKSIEGYENYIIYEDGLIYNEKFDRFIKQYKNNMGYMSICLCKDNKKKTFLFSINI